MVIDKTKVSSATKIFAVILYLKDQEEDPPQTCVCHLYCCTSVRMCFQSPAVHFVFVIHTKLIESIFFKATMSYFSLWKPYMIPNSAKLFCKSKTYTMKYTTKNIVIYREECIFICGKKGLNLGADGSQIPWLLLRCSAGLLGTTHFVFELQSPLVAAFVQIQGSFCIC